jgi:gliding motility-associated-like protein
MKKNIILALVLTVISCYSFSQMTISTGVLTPAQYVNNLVGPGIAVSNVTYTGTTQQIGSFGGTSNIGFASGVVISSGATTELVGPASATSDGQINVSGISNADLLSVANLAATAVGSGTITSTTDAAILEFDFVPVSNLVSFNFVFASDEYLTYVNTVFNDVFGFFVSGPGITGPYASPAGFPNGSTNLALVPGTTSPITISTIHPGLNSQYYVNNSGNTQSMNGFTTPIPVTFAVICGETYHFKFAVADCQDNFLSTAVFMQDASFVSPPVDLSLETANGTDTIPEACVDANVLFIRSSCQSNLALTVDYTVTGTAIDGTDFNIAASPIILASGQDTASINIIPIVDALAEGTETIIITVTFLDALGNPQSISGTLYIADIEPLSINETDLTFQCYNDSIELTAIGSGGSGVFTYDWQQSLSDSIHDYVSINQNGSFEYLVTMTDICLGSITDTVTVIMNQTLVVDTMIMGPATCEPVGFVSGMVTGQTGVPSYQWTGPGAGNPAFIDASVWQNLSSGWYYFNVFDNVCEVHDSIFVAILNPPIAQFMASATAGCDPLTILFTNNSQNALNYAWNFGNGNTANVTSTAAQTQVYSNSTVVRLIASQGNCADTAYTSITISICGCLDPLASNYNPAANVDDGSCIYPFPEVFAPNVFTPNSDAENPTYFLSGKNLVSLELTILNRWGAVVFSKSSSDLINNNPAWDGKINGDLATDGIYFYIYKATGITNQIVEGHGFLHLISDK